MLPVTERTAPSIRARVRAEMTEEIKAVARRHLAADGANLSLRAVARDLGMVSSALYRYFASRDDLLPALILDAYDSLGDAVERADAAVDRGDVLGRWLAACRAVRAWALANPHQYALIYGSPVPGYRAPQDVIAGGEGWHGFGEPGVRGSLRSARACRAAARRGYRCHRGGQLRRSLGQRHRGRGWRGHGRTADRPGHASWQPCARAADRRYHPCRRYAGTGVAGRAGGRAECRSRRLLGRTSRRAGPAAGARGRRTGRGRHRRRTADLRAAPWLSGA